jgi:hypothetical protein
MIILCQEQFNIPFPLSLLAAYHATRAAIAWAPLDHDLRAVEAAYTRFYRLARHYAGRCFDPQQVAALELEYNVVHRQLVGCSDKSAFVDTMTRLHSALFGLSPEQARESAEPATADKPADDFGRSYAFTSVWQVAAPIQAVWDAIYDSQRWPTWWRYVAAVDELAPGDGDGVGAVRRYTWTTQLPYRLVFESTVTRVEAPNILEASANGQLVGSGCWR